MSLVVFQHVDLLGKLAITFLTLVFFDALVKLHVVPQSMFGFHACTKNHHETTAQHRSSHVTQHGQPDLCHTLHTGSHGCRREL